MGVLPEDTALLDEYRQRHYDKYPRLHRIRLHMLWTGLHSAIAVGGFALIIVILAK
jgi:hypothetical protein